VGCVFLSPSGMSLIGYRSQALSRTPRPAARNYHGVDPRVVLASSRCDQKAAGRRPISLAMWTDRYAKLAFMFPNRGRGRILK
jgi:hypothetical protein